jgi:uncharacterized OB-fold protein
MTQPANGPAAAAAEPAVPVEPVRPEITDLNRPFWDGCAAGQLRLQVCECGHTRYPISEICPSCLSETFAWKPMSGRGEILSWVVFQRAYQSSWAAAVPYNVVLVQLAEGPRMFGNVLPLGRQELRVGQAVEVAFDRLDDQLTIPRWTVTEKG